jgi:hypothetical protein
MKATSKISKREVMSRAWRIYRSKWNGSSFGECLSRAWTVEKENLVYREEQAIEAAWKAEHPARNLCIPFEFDPAVMEAYYSRSGAYVGD